MLRAWQYTSTVRTFGSVEFRTERELKMTTAQTITTNYRYCLRDMCEQEYIKKKVADGFVTYTFFDDSYIALKALDDDL